MTLNHIKVFCCVFQHESISKAASLLNMAQPGVSRIISEIEAFYNVTLFLRKNRRIIPTTQAQQLYMDGEKLLKDFLFLEANLRRNQPKAVIQIGCSTGIGLLIMQEAYTIFNKKYPNCNLYVCEGTSEEITKEVADGKYDFGFVQTLFPRKELNQEVFCNDHLVAVCSPDFKPKTCFGKEYYSINDLSKERLITTVIGTGLRTEIDNYARKEGVNLNPIWNCNSGDHALTLALSGAGIAILSNRTVAKEVNAGNLLYMPLSFNIKRAFSMIWRKNSFFSEEEEFLANTCKDIGLKKKG